MGKFFNFDTSSSLENALIEAIFATLPSYSWLLGRVVGNWKIPGSFDISMGLLRSGNFSPVTVFTCLLDSSGVVAGGPGRPCPPLNRGANGDKGAPKLFSCNIFG